MTLKDFLNNYVISQVSIWDNSSYLSLTDGCGEPIITIDPGNINIDYCIGEKLLNDEVDYVDSHEKYGLCIILKDEVE